MIDINHLKSLIIERLKPLNPEKIILFGSYAYGKPNEDSDIDLYIVTNDNIMPKNWKEKNAIQLKYSRQLRDLQKIIPIDIIVHTKQMYEKFKNINSSFYKYDIQKGQLLC